MHYSVLVFLPSRTKESQIVTAVEERMAKFREAGGGDDEDPAIEMAFNEEYPSVEAALSDLVKSPVELLAILQHPRKAAARLKQMAGFDIQDGAVGYLTNPQGRWDWFSIGGGWSDSLLVRPSAWHFNSDRVDGRPPLDTKTAVSCDGARIKDLLTGKSYDRARRSQLLRIWKEADTTAHGWMLQDFGLPKGSSAGDWADKALQADKPEYQPYCFVARDGEWCEQSSYVSAACKFEENADYTGRFREEMEKNTDDLVVMVDIHS